MGTDHPEVLVGKKNTSQNHELWGRKSDDWLQAEVGIGTIHFLCGDTSIITISVPVQCVPCLRWGHVWPQPQASAQCCQLRPISGEWSLSQTQSTNHAWRDEGFSRHPAVRYTPHFSWTMRVVADTPHVSLSLDLLLFSSLPKWKLMLTIKHQTLTRTEHGTKGTMQSLCRHTRPSWTIDESVKCNFYHSFLMSATIKKIILW